MKHLIASLVILFGTASPALAAEDVSTERTTIGDILNWLGGEFRELGGWLKDWLYFHICLMQGKCSISEMAIGFVIFDLFILTWFVVIIVDSYNERILRKEKEKFEEEE